MVAANWGVGGGGVLHKKQWLVVIVISFTGARAHYLSARLSHQKLDGFRFLLMVPRFLCPKILADIFSFANQKFRSLIIKNCIHFCGLVRGMFLLHPLPYL